MSWINLKQLCEKLGDRSKRAIYDDLKKGLLPQPLKLNGTNLWNEEEIDKHLADMALKQREEAGK